MNFDLNWFLTVPGMFISAGVLLLVVAIIVLIVSSAKGKKEKKKVEKVTPATPDVKVDAAVVNGAAVVNTPQTGNVPNQMPVDVLQQQNIPMMQQQNVPSDLGVQPASVNNGMPQVNVMPMPGQMQVETLQSFQNIPQPNIGMTQNIPIVEPAPMVQEVQVVKPAPMVQSAPIVEPAPMIQEVPIVEPAPMMQGAPIVEPAPMVQEVPIAEPAPMMQSAPIVEPAPMVQEVPIAEPAPMMQNAPIIEPTPMVQEVQNVEPVSTTATPIGMVPTATVTPVMQSTPMMQTSQEVESLSYNQPVASYQNNAYVDNTNSYANVQNENVGVMPVASVAPTTQPVIYGGASPIVSDLNIGQNTQHQIYGGANPLENTQSMPIMSTPVSNQTESVMPYGDASFSQTVPVTNDIHSSVQQ